MKIVSSDCYKPSTSEHSSTNACRFYCYPAQRRGRPAVFEQNSSLGPYRGEMWHCVGTELCEPRRCLDHMGEQYIHEPTRPQCSYCAPLHRPHSLKTQISSDQPKGLYLISKPTHLLSKRLSRQDDTERICTPQSDLCRPHVPARALRMSWSLRSFQES